jgi:hypothetical protein
MRAFAIDRFGDLGTLRDLPTPENVPFWGEEELHNLDGGGEAAGLSAKKIGPHTKMTDRNKEMMRRGLPVKNPQQL